MQDIYVVCLTAIREAWNAAANTEDKREKIQALSLAKECYSMKLELLTNATVVDDAIRFVSNHSKVKLRLSSSNSSSDEENSKSHDDIEEYEMADQQGEQEHEVLGSTYTTNEVF
jgi:hypothetical protein